MNREYEFSVVVFAKDTAKLYRTFKNVREVTPLLYALSCTKKSRYSTPISIISTRGMSNAASIVKLPFFIFLTKISLQNIRSAETVQKEFPHFDSFLA